MHMYDRDRLLAAAKRGALQSSSWLLRAPSLAAMVMVIIAVEVTTEQFTARLLGRLLLGVGGVATLISVVGVRWILAAKIHRALVRETSRLFKQFETIPGDDREWQAEVSTLLGSLREAIPFGLSFTSALVAGSLVGHQLDACNATIEGAIALGIASFAVTFLVLSRIGTWALKQLLIPSDIRHLF